MPTTKKITKVPQPNEVTVLISQALSNNVPVETLERLFSLREKVKAETAKEAFIGALAHFQENCPIIEKTKEVKNKDGTTVRYKYAPIDSIIQQIKTPLSQNNLSYTWTVENEDKLISVTATVTHALGHSESSSFRVPIDDNQYMTSPQRYASALTFAKRYSLCNVLGISTGDEDTDATDVNKEKDPISPKAKIVFLLKTLKQDVSTKETIDTAVKDLAKVDLVKENYDEIVSRLELLVKESNEDITIQ